jgi:hypothetical protein
MSEKQLISLLNHMHLQLCFTEETFREASYRALSAICYQLT